MNTILRGIRNAFRNSIRTVSIVIILGLSIGLALTMLVARQAVVAKINSVKSSIGNTVTISPAGSRGFEGGGNPLTSAELDKVKTLPHVASVTETLQDRLDSTTTNLQSSIQAGALGRRFNGGGAGGGGNAQGGGTGGTFTPPVIISGTNNLSGTAALAQGGGSISVTSGKTFDASIDANVALVGKDLASKNSLNAGSTFQAYGTTITVSGIYDAGNTFSNSALVMPLATAQRLSGQVGDITGAVVQVDSITNVASTSTNIQNTLGTSVADVVSQQDSSNQALAPLENIKSISVVSLIGAVVAGSVIILLTMLMIVRERRREIGVLKAIGASNLKVMAQFMSEAVTFTLLGAVVGLGLGVIGAGPVTKLLVTTSSNSATPVGGPGGGGFGRGAGGFFRAAGLGGNNLRNLHAVVGFGIVGYGLAAALLIALVGSAIPAGLLAKIRPAEVMRAE